MTSLCRLLSAAALTIPLALPVNAQQGAGAQGGDQEEIDVASMTCADFLEVEEVDRMEVMQLLAEETGVQAADLGEDGLSEMTTRCEENLQAEAPQIFEEAMEIESNG